MPRSVGDGRDRSSSTYRRPAIRESRFTSGLPKVIILHDHEFVSEVLTFALMDEIDVVAETRSGRAAVALSELLVPDVVVLGEMLIDGVSDVFIPALLQTGSRVLLVSDHHELSRMLDLVEMGVTGIVDMDQTLPKLTDAVLTLAGGMAALPSEVVGAIANDWRRNRRNRSTKEFDVDLTGRESEILGAMSDGLSTKAIAHHLAISVKTVENHKTRIFGKLGVRSQAQAVALVAGRERKGAVR